MAHPSLYLSEGPVLCVLRLGPESTDAQEYAQVRAAMLGALSKADLKTPSPKDKQSSVMSELRNIQASMQLLQQLMAVDSAQSDITGGQSRETSQLRSQLSRATKEADELRKETDQLRKENKALKVQLRESKNSFAPFPPSDYELYQGAIEYWMTHHSTKDKQDVRQLLSEALSQGDQLPGVVAGNAELAVHAQAAVHAYARHLDLTAEWEPHEQQAKTLATSKALWALYNRDV